MKKVVSILCALTICFGSVVFASDFEYTKIENNNTPLTTLTPTGGLLIEEGFSDKAISEEFMLMSSGQSSISFEEYMREQLINHTEVIDISAYKIPVSAFYYVYFSFIFTNSDLPIHAAYSNRILYSLNDVNYVKSFEPLYIYETKEESDTKFASLNNLTTSLAEYANKGKTELEKALFLFDKISLDYYYSPTDEYERISHTPYGFLDNGHGVCQGYAILYKLVLDKLGIKSYVCTNSNESVNHAWNYILIDDKWYHADPTWSYYSNTTEKVSRNYFLLSDASMLADTKHGVQEDWIPFGDITEAIECISEDYADGFLFRYFTGAPIYRDELSLYFTEQFTVSSETIELTLRNDTLKTPDAIMSEPSEVDGTTKINLLTINSINKKTNIIMSGYTKEGKFTGCDKLTATSLSSGLIIQFPIPEFNTTPHKVKWMLLDSATLSPITYFSQMILN